MRVALVGVVQQAHRSLRRFGETATVGMTRALFDERGYFAFFEIERLELADLEPEHLDARVAIACPTFELGRAIHVGDPGLVGLTHAVRELGVLAEVVDKFALRRRARERLEFVLPMDINNDAADVAQQRERNRDSIEITARAAVVRDHAAYR